MSPLVAEIIVGIATVFISVGASAFISGMHWGELRTDVRTMSDRLAKIEGMFVLQLKSDSSKHAD